MLYRDGSIALVYHELCKLIHVQPEQQIFKSEYQDDKPQASY